MDLLTLEYPRHVHKPSVWGAWNFLVVQTADECEKALAEGWSLSPVLVASPADAIAPPAPVSEPVEPVKKGKKK